MRDEPKPEPAIDNPNMNKKRIIMIAAGAAGILVLVAVAILFSQTSLTLDPAPESDTLNVPRPESETLVDLSSPQVIFKLYGKTSDKIVNNTYSRIIIQPRDDAESLYSYLRNADDSTIAVYPSFTRTAYSPGGLANHYLAGCENCIASSNILDGASLQGHKSKDTRSALIKILKSALLHKDQNGLLMIGYNTNVYDDELTAVQVLHHTV